MPIKTDEKTLERKREYYKENKDKILARKHERKDEIYANKIARAMSDPDEWHKEQMRKLSKLDNIRTDKCELCSIKQSEIDHPLEGHHMNYNDTKMVFVCRPCHNILDKMRRRED